MKVYMITNAILATGLLLLFSYWGGKSANALNFPRVTGYLCAGLVLNPSVSGILNLSTVTEDLHVITEIALGIIAYSIGGSLELRHIRHLGRTIGYISITQALGACIISSVLLFLSLPFLSQGLLTGHVDLEMLFSVSIVLGAISAATAPGAVLAIVSELKASGSFTSVLLGVIAVDDAITIILFAAASVIAHNLINPSDISWLSMLIAPLEEIGISLVIGMAGGMLLKYTASRIKNRGDMLMVVMGVIFLVTGISKSMGVSRLLSAMTLGITAVNSHDAASDWFNITEIIENGIFGLFFALAGAYMDITVLKTTWMLSIAMLVFRMTGKHLGTWIGAVMCGAGKEIKKYLSLALFPQAGVTIGLVLLSADLFPEHIYRLLLNAVIGTVIINEFIAPPFVKFALEKSENIDKTSSMGSVSSV